MKHIKSFEKCSNVSEIRQLLQTLHKEFFKIAKSLIKTTRKN